MRVVIRTDASVRIATGHGMRCQALAAELGRRGADIVIVCREHEGNLIGALRADGYDVRGLPSRDPASAGQPLAGYAAWLATSQAEDASETLAVIGGVPLDWVVVDHYALSAPWHRALRTRACRIMAIDDLADRPLDCDLLLDPSLSEVDGASRYADLIPDDCQSMFGPRFALLSPGYALRRETLGVRSGEVRTALITMGGNDLPDATGLIVKAMCAPGLMHIELDVVVGANYPHRERLARLLSDRGNGGLRGPLPSLVEAMAAADLAIGAGGSTSWERLCLGLPAILVSIAENQMAGCRALDSAGAAIYAGHLDELTSEALTSVLLNAASNPPLLRGISEVGLSMVDGRGTSRVADRLMELT